MRISMGYPEKSDEITILERNRMGNQAGVVKPVAASADVLALQNALEEIKCTRSVMNYIVDLAQFTRDHKDVSLGVSPRGSIALMRASMGLAMMEGRDHILPDDVQKMLKPVLAHRLALHSQAYIQNQTAESILDGALRGTPVPVIR